jgi:hypothetical protein
MIQSGSRSMWSARVRPMPLEAQLMTMELSKVADSPLPWRAR